MSPHRVGRDQLRRVGVISIFSGANTFMIDLSTTTTNVAAAWIAVG